MKHTSLNVKKFTVKESEAFRVRVESWEVVSPKGLYAIDMIQESLDDDGNVADSSTYNFHLTKEEISDLCKGLLTV
jgi:hypothetical protein